MQFPTQLAHVVHTHGDSLRVADGDGAHRQPREGSVGQFVVGQLREQFTRLRAHNNERAVACREIADLHAAIRRQMFAQPMLVMAFTSRGRDKPVVVRPESSNRHFRNDAAARRTEVVQCSAARLRQRTGDHVVNPGGSAGARDFELREAREVQHGHAVLHGVDFPLDGLVPRRTAEAMQRAAGEVIALREEHRTFPTTASTEVRALRLQTQVRRRGLGRTASRTLFSRVPDTIFVLVGFDRLGRSELGVRVLKVAARIQRPHVPFGVPVRYPFGNDLACTTGLGNAKSERGAVVEARQPRRRTNQRVAIGRVRDGAVDDALDANATELRHAQARVFDVLLEAVRVVVEQLVRELVGNTVLPMHASVPLVGAQDKAVTFLTQVIADVRVAHERQTRVAARQQLRHVFGNKVLVRQSDDRQECAHHGRHFTPAIAAGVDDLLGRDDALVRLNAPFARRRARNRGDARVAMDCATTVTSTLGQGLRQLRGIDVAVIRVVQATEDVVRFEERVTLADFARAEHFEVDALRMALRHHVAELVHAVARVRKTNAARDVVVDVVADLLAKRRIQLGAVALQLDDVPRGGEVRTVAGRVPGGPGRQFVTLQQYGVGDAELSEMVEGTAAHRAAANDDDLCMRFHGYSQLLMRSFFGS